MHDWVDILNEWPGDESLLGYNVSPTSVAPIIISSGVIQANWGLIPSWSRQFKTKYATFNAKVETLAEKPTFRSAWKQGRVCLVPCGGYYEWRTEDGIKQPYVIHNPAEPIVMAGLWEAWNDQVSFTVITEDAKGHLNDLHHRMPVMLQADQAQDWLNGVKNLNTSTWEQLKYYKVDRAVGNTQNEGPELIKPK